MRCIATNDGANTDDSIKPTACGQLLRYQRQLKAARHFDRCQFVGISPACHQLVLAAIVQLRRYMRVKPRHHDGKPQSGCIEIALEAESAFWHPFLRARRITDSPR